MPSSNECRCEKRTCGCTHRDPLEAGRLSHRGLFARGTAYWRRVEQYVELGPNGPPHCSVCWN